MSIFSSGGIYAKAATRGVLWKKVFTCQSLFFVKKETLTQVFSCEICQSSKNTCLAEHLRTTVSIYAFYRDFLSKYLSWLYFRSYYFFQNRQNKCFCLSDKVWIYSNFSAIFLKYFGQVFLSIVCLYDTMIKRYLTIQWLL